MEEGSNEDKSKTREKEDESKEEEATSEKVTVVEPPSVVGCYQKVVFSYKSNTDSKVSRSFAVSATETKSINKSKCIRPSIFH
jgi:hypothetical protein